MRFLSRAIFSLLLGGLVGLQGWGPAFAGMGAGRQVPVAPGGSVRVVGVVSPGRALALRSSLLTGPADAVRLRVFTLDHGATLRPLSELAAPGVPEEEDLPPGLRQLEGVLQGEAQSQREQEKGGAPLESSLSGGRAWDGGGSGAAGGDSSISSNGLPPEFTETPLKPSVFILDLDAFTKPVSRRLIQHIIKLQIAGLKVIVVTEGSEAKVRRLLTDSMGRFGRDKLLIVSDGGANISNIYKDIFLSKRSKPFNETELEIVRSAAREALSELGGSWNEVREIRPQRAFSHFYQVRLPRFRYRGGRKIAVPVEAFRKDFNKELEKHGLGEGLHAEILSRRNPKFMLGTSPKKIEVLKKITKKLAKKYKISERIWDSKFPAKEAPPYFHQLELPASVDVQKFLEKWSLELENYGLSYRAGIVEEKGKTEGGPRVIIRSIRPKEAVDQFEDVLRRDMGNHAVPQDILFLGGPGNKTFQHIRESLAGAPYVEVGSGDEITGVLEQLLGEWNEYRYGGPGVRVLHVSASKVAALHFQSRFGSGEKHEQFKKHYLDRDRSKTVYMVMGDIVHNIFEWITFTHLTAGILPSPEEVGRMYLTLWNRHIKSSKPLEPRTQEILNFFYATSVHLQQMYADILPVLKRHRVYRAEKPFFYTVREYDRRTHRVKTVVATTGKFDLLTLDREGDKNILYIHDFKTGWARTKDELLKDPQVGIYYLAGLKTKAIWLDGKPVPIDEVRLVFHYDAISNSPDVHEGIVYKVKQKIIRSAKTAEKLLEERYGEGFRRRMRQGEPKGGSSKAR